MQRFDPLRLVVADLAEGQHRGAERRLVGGIEPMRGEDEPVHRVVLERDDGEPEVPLARAGRSGDGGQAIDVELFDRAFHKPVDPPGADVVFERCPVRQRDAVEAQSLRAAVLHAQHRLRRILEDEPVRRREGEAELGLDEPATADRPLGRIVAEHHSVDRREIGLAVAGADIGCADAARDPHRRRDAFRRGGMRRENVRLRRAGVLADQRGP